MMNVDITILPICIRGTYLITITIVGCSWFILNDRYTLDIGCEEIPKITMQDMRIIMVVAAAAWLFFSMVALNDPLAR
jgi:hypothetical protein